jgi:hypothetical protein
MKACYVPLVVRPEQYSISTDESVCSLANGWSSPERNQGFREKLQNYIH